MPLSQEKVEWLEGFFTDFGSEGQAALEEKRISKKSYDFAYDQRSRFYQYRERMYLSEKQEAWLRSIADDMTQVQGNGSAKLLPDNNVSKLGKEIGPGRAYTREEFDDDIPF